MMGKYVLILALCLMVTWCVEEAVGQPSDFADCTVKVTVDEIIEWDGTDITDITPANITTRALQPTDSSSFTLWLNGDLEITADNTANSQLASLTDTLVTEYKISTDGNGAAASGAVGGETLYALHDAFLYGAPFAITHVNQDGNVEITLTVRASNRADMVSDAGNYQAVQRLTAAWVD